LMPRICLAEWVIPLFRYISCCRSAHQEHDKSGMRGPYSLMTLMDSSQSVPAAANTQRPGHPLFKKRALKIHIHVTDISNREREFLMDCGSTDTDPSGIAAKSLVAHRQQSGFPHWLTQRDRVSRRKVDCWKWRSDFRREWRDLFHPLREIFIQNRDTDARISKGNPSKIQEDSVFAILQLSQSIPNKSERPSGNKYLPERLSFILIFFLGEVDGLEVHAKSNISIYLDHRWEFWFIYMGWDWWEG
jgi:hypothetical protein